GAPMKNLAHSASFDSDEKYAPSKPGIKQLGEPASRSTIRALYAWASAASRPSSTSDTDVKPAAIPIKDRPPFRFEAGHHSNQKPASFRH
ncbi:hypothetical protein NKI89_31405, partial [Mesorhizobium sp. M0309]|uniref:hypothetical protein n=1 Tax=Mesorhizobium sp. M0309 TaxID=2956933 RepID=UPI00333BA35E